MHRSFRNQVIDECSIRWSSSSSSEILRAEFDSDKSLPTSNPDCDWAKKERSRLRSAENCVHFIPVLIVLCAVLLWFFSHPDRLENQVYNT